MPVDFWQASLPDYKEMIMLKTDFHRKEIIRILKEAGDKGINSKYLINHVTPRYSARLKELRQSGYHIYTKRERIAGSNFIRLWLDQPQEKKFVWKFKDNVAYKQYI